MPNIKSIFNLTKYNKTKKGDIMAMSTVVVRFMKQTKIGCTLCGTDYEQIRFIKFRSSIISIH